MLVRLLAVRVRAGGVRALLSNPNEELEALETDPEFGLPALLAAGEYVRMAVDAVLAGRRCRVVVTDSRLLAMRLVPYGTSDVRLRGRGRFAGSRVLELPMTVVGSVERRGTVVTVVDLAGRKVPYGTDTEDDATSLAAAIRTALALAIDPDGVAASTDPGPVLSAFHEWMTTTDPVERGRVAARTLSVAREQDRPHPRI